MNARKDASELLDDIRGCLEQMRRTLMRLFESIGVNHEHPDALAGRLGIGVDLSSQLAQMLAAPDTFDMLRHMPWQKGFTALEEAFRKAGASEAARDELRALAQRFGEIMSDGGGRLHVESQLARMGLVQSPPRAVPQWQPVSSDVGGRMPKALRVALIGCCAGLFMAFRTYLFPSSDLEEANRLASAIGSFLGSCVITLPFVIAIAIAEEKKRQRSER